MLTKVATVLVLAGVVILGRAQAAAPADAPQIDEKRGCCSHHGGVCGCVDGRQKCCDGNFSPSCTC